MGAEFELVFVAPEEFGFGVIGGVFEEHVVEVDDLVAGTVADHDEHGALVGLYSVLYQSLDA